MRRLGLSIAVFVTESAETFRVHAIPAGLWRVLCRCCSNLSGISSISVMLLEDVRHLPLFFALIVSEQCPETMREAGPFQPMFSSPYEDYPPRGFCRFAGSRSILFYQQIEPQRRASKGNDSKF